MEKEFREGERVKTIYGQVRTVLRQKNESQVLVIEECNGWYHPSKLWKI